MPERRPVTATTLERYADAYVAALSTWIYPSDVELRFVALQSCALCNIDYIETVANIIESTNASSDNARLLAAEYFHDKLLALVKRGDAPRLGIAADGQPTDNLGRTERPDTNEED